jgi:Arc/MetJ family transcription regulator
VRTTLNLDEKTLSEAMRYAEGRSKTELINHALREFARRKRQLELLQWRGRARWEGDLDELRGSR